MQERFEIHAVGKRQRRTWSGSKVQREPQQRQPGAEKNAKRTKTAIPQCLPSIGRQKIAHHIGRKDNAVEHRPREARCAAERKKGGHQAKERLGERRHERQKRRPHKEERRERAEKEQQLVAPGTFEQLLGKRNIEDKGPPKRSENDRGRQAHGRREGRANVLIDRAAGKHLRIDSGADEPVDQHRRDVVRSEVRPLHKTRRPAENPHQHCKRKTEARGARVFVAQHEVKRKEAEPGSRVSGGPAVPRAEKERKARVHNDAINPEGFRVPRTGNARRAFQPPNEKNACGHPGEQIEKTLFRVQEPACGIGCATLAASEDGFDKKTDRTQSNHNRYGLEALVKNGRKEVDPVPGPAAAVEKGL